jgi:hypothetical protein
MLRQWDVYSAEGWRKAGDPVRRGSFSLAIC